MKFLVVAGLWLVCIVVFMALWKRLMDRSIVPAPPEDEIEALTKKEARPYVDLDL